MTSAVLDRLLAILVAAQLATGLLSLRAGSPPTAPLFVVHGLLGGALLVAVGLKLWRSVPGAIAAGRWGRLALGTLLAGLALVALLGGLAWVASGRILSLGPWTVLSWHVFAALALLPIVVFHLVPRRWRLLRPPPAGRRLSRRALLGTAAVAGLGAAVWVGTNVLDAVQGGRRRFTGSRALPADGIPPPTTFFGEPAPAVEPAAWQLRIHGAIGEARTFTLDDLAALPQTDADPILDCTGGWWMRTTWSGVSLGTLLDAAQPSAAARHVTVRSATGWYARMPLHEARRALLATAVAGQPLPVGNGAPLRLVAPDRRGLEWVKWVDEIEIS